MNILITGDKGFIGSRLTERLKERKDVHLFGYDLKDGLDILDTKQLKKTLSANKYDVIIHLAAKTSVEESHRMPEEYFRTNTEGTKNIVKMANECHVKRIIYAATAASLIPKSSPYASSKLESEHQLKLFNGQHIVLRFFNVVGRRSNPNYCGVIDAFREGIKKGKITIYGDGKQTRDFVHIDDVCDAIIAACFTSHTENLSLEVGSGKEISINDLAKKMINKKNVEIIHGPERKEVRNSIANVKLTKEILGFDPHMDISEFFT